jgi:Flp pilus assembly protein TadD
MRRMRKTVVAAVCSLVMIAGCASGSGKTAWWPSWKLPTVKLPTIKNPFSKEDSTEQALAVLEQDKQPSQAPPAKQPDLEKRPDLATDSLAAKATVVSLQPSAPPSRAPLPTAPAAQSSPVVQSPVAVPSQPVVANDQKDASKLAKSRAPDPKSQPAATPTSYERAVAERSPQAVALHRQGQAAARDGHYLEAERLYSQALAISPRDAEMLNDLGFCLYCQGKLPQAEATMLKAVALQPADPQLHTNLGVVYGHQGRCREALEQFRLAGSSEADACTNLAEILVARNDRTAAQSYLRQALAAEPGHTRAQKVLETLAQVEPSKTETRSRMAKFPSPLPPKVTR